MYTNDDHHKQIGYATSGTWSPTLKQNIAIAILETPHDKLGSDVQFEVMVEHYREIVRAIVGKPQFFNPERKRSILKKHQDEQKI